MEKLTVTVTQCAQMLGISRNTAYAQIATGALPHLRIGKRILVPRVALDRMLAQAGQGAKAET